MFVQSEWFATKVVVFVSVHVVHFEVAFVELYVVVPHVWAAFSDIWLQLLQTFQWFVSSFVHKPYECPNAATVSCTTKIVLQTEQWEPSIKPVLVQVAATASSVTSVWPKASPSVALQPEHVFGVSQSGSTQVCSWINLSIFSSFVYLHTVQVKTFVPSCSVVGSNVTFPVSQVCSFFY